MNFEKGDLAQSFKQNTQNNTDIESVEPDVPQMIEEEQPVPRPHPPGMGNDVDAQIFDQRWQQELKAHQVPDAFDQIDAQQQATLSERFNDRSSEHSATSQENVSDKTRENNRDAFDRIDDSAALSDRFNTHARDLERG